MELFSGGPLQQPGGRKVSIIHLELFILWESMALCQNNNITQSQCVVAAMIKVPPPQQGNARHVTAAGGKDEASPIPSHSCPSGEADTLCVSFLLHQ